MSFEPREYLRQIFVEVEFLQGSSSGLSIEDFPADETLRRAAVRSLEIIGEAARKLQDDFQAKYPAIE